MKIEPFVGGGSGKLVTGTPSEIIKDTMDDIVHALEKAKVPITGLLAIALIDLGAILAKGDYDNNFTQQPSFATLLSSLVRQYTDSAPTEAEVKHFMTDFERILTSLGGSKNSVKSQNHPLLMAPMSDIVH